MDVPRIDRQLGSLQELANEFTDSFARFESRIRAQFAELKIAVDANRATFDNLQSQLARAFRVIAEDLPSSVRTLSDHGWFVNQSSEIPQVLSIAKELDNGNDSVGNAQMCKHFEDLFEKICGQLVSTHRNRESILQKAFAAHRAGDYELSVPVLLAQADGIGHELFGVSPYTRHPRRRKKMSDVLHTAPISDPASITQLLLSLAVADHPISQSTTNANYTGVLLSRHAILHGLQLNYGTKANSLRALSWLGYVSYISHICKKPPIDS